MTIIRSTEFAEVRAEIFRLDEGELTDAAVAHIQKSILASNLADAEWEFEWGENNNGAPELVVRHIRKNTKVVTHEPKPA